MPPRNSTSGRAMDVSSHVSVGVADVMIPLILVTLGRDNDPLKLPSRVISPLIVVQLCVENQFRSSGEARWNAAGVFWVLGSMLRLHVVAETTDHVRSVGLVERKHTYTAIQEMPVRSLNTDENGSSYASNRDAEKIRKTRGRK